ncbi:enoyl-CoA hydratase/isomerase family protein [Rhodococcus opacus]|nr:enoyl-CoA hydratase/isomerase family protein [Rhodococcus opacus]
MNQDKTVLVERHTNGIYLARLNRPDRLNAINVKMFQELKVLCEDFETDPSARALVVTGEGRGFCSGLDLDVAAEIPEMTVSQMHTNQAFWASAVTGLWNVRKPVIAAVNGPAAGAGLALALSADVRVASRSATFNAAFIRIGLSGGDCGTSWLLPRLVGLGHANEILMTGRIIEGAEAERIGLVNRTVDDGALLDAALSLAQQICANSPLGVELTKSAVQANLGASSLAAALQLENRNQVLSSRSADMSEALSAFRQNRAPVFTS